MSQSLEVKRGLVISRRGEPVYGVAQSANGQYTAVVTDNGLLLFDASGKQLLRYPPQAWPMHLVVGSASFSYLLVGARRGAVTRLNLKREGEGFSLQEQVLYFADNDLNTISLAEHGEMFSIGHYGPALAVANIQGDIVWQQHPDKDNSTDGSYWSVRFDEAGQHLYIASAGFGANRLAVLDARSGECINDCPVKGRITRLTVFSQKTGIAIVLNDGYSYWLQTYSADLSSLLWEVEYSEPVTALTADRNRNLLVIAIGYQGDVFVLDTETGQMLTEPVTVQSYVNDLAISNGSSIAAATEDGSLYLIRYQDTSWF